MQMQLLIVVALIAFATIACAQELLPNADVGFVGPTAGGPSALQRLRGAPRRRAYRRRLSASASGRRP